jgi:hypothetical protein
MKIIQMRDSYLEKQKTRTNVRGLAGGVALGWRRRAARAGAGAGTAARERERGRRKSFRLSIT